MKDWEKELYVYRLDPAPPKMKPQEYIEEYLKTKDEKYLSWYLHYREPKINEMIKNYVQEYAMQGHFMDMKSAYVFGILKALQKYDPKKGAFFSSFQEYYVKKEIDNYVRTMRTGYTVPSDSEYAFLRKVMVLYALHGYRSDIKTISRISAEVDRKPKVVREMITGAVRNMMYAEFYRMYEDDDGEDGTEDVTSDTSSDPAVVFHDYREFQTLSEAFDKLEYRERAIVSAHLAFCPECWGLEYSVAEASEKIKASFKEEAFIDIAAMHGITPATADRTYRKAIGKLKTAILEDKML